MKKILKYWYVILLILIVSLLYIFTYGKENEYLEDEVIEVADIATEETVVEDIVKTYFVDIKGEVKKAGVYEIEEGKRVIDVIKLAGGLTKNADTTLINLSKKVYDEMSIKIYSKKEVENAYNLIEPKVVEVIKEVEKIVEKECECDTNNACIDETSLIEENDNKININTASKEALMSITGIGESKAIAIIEYRSNSKYNSIEDIKNVSGIGDSLFEKIKEYITV